MKIKLEPRKEMSEILSFLLLLPLSVFLPTFLMLFHVRKGKGEDVGGFL